MDLKVRWIEKGGDFSDAAKVRKRVFVEEQSYSLEEEFDSLDSVSEHLVLYDKDKEIACGRLIDLGGGAYKLGRIAVDKEYRGRGLGLMLVNLLSEKAEEKGATRLLIGAQTRVVPFYEKLGFVPYGLEYMDGHIPHVDMAKCLDFKDCRWLMFRKNAEAFLARKTIYLTKKVKSAVLRICTLGFVEFYVNGQRITDDLNVPAWTNYEYRDLSKIHMPIYDTLTHRVYYLEYDITSFLKDGENALGVHVGNGFYGQHESRNEGFTRCGDLKLAFSINLIYEDGELERIVSDSTVKVYESYILRTNIYFGEIQNLNNEPEGWNDAGFDDSEWYPPALADAPKSILEKQECPPDRVIRTIQPKLISKKGDHSVYDLGENVAGYPVLKFPEKSRANETALLRIAEEINEDGTLYFFSAGDIHRIQQDFYIHNGKDDSLYYPRFTWHAGRYFEIIGTAEPLEFRVIHTDIKNTSEFESSDDLLNWYYEAYIRTQLNNIHCCVPSDCPHRERLGYTGDGQIASGACMTTLSAKEMFKKWMKDIADNQDRFGGHVQHTAPFYGGGGGPGGWGGAIVIVPYNYYRYYGDTDVLREYYPNMVKYIEYMVSRCEDNLVVREEEGGWCLGDWCTPHNIILIPEPFVNTYYLIKTARITLEVAKILGINKDNEYLNKVIDDCSKAMHDNYFDEKTGSFLEGIQGADAFAADLGLGDERTLKNLVDKYTQIGRFDTGIFGTYILLDVLFKNGYGELAYKLLTNKSKVSFHRMRESGATTLWEEWEGRHSHSHPMFGGSVEHLFSYILGIKNTEGTVGFKDVTIAPADIPSLSYVKGSMLTENGRITVEIDRRNGETRIDAKADDGIIIRRA